jgi:hypothetical protein
MLVSWSLGGSHFDARLFFEELCIFFEIVFWATLIISYHFFYYFHTLYFLRTHCLNFVIHNLHALNFLRHNLHRLDFSLGQILATQRFLSIKLGNPTL